MEKQKQVTHLKIRIVAPIAISVLSFAIIGYLFYNLQKKILIENQPVIKSDAKTEKIESISKNNNLIFRNISVNYPMDAINKKGTLSLVFMPSFSTNKFEVVDLYKLEISNVEGNNIKEVQLNKPLKLSYDFSKDSSFQKNMKECNWDLSTLSFYASKPGTFAHDDLTINGNMKKLDSRISNKNVLESELDYLGEFTENNIQTTIVLGIEPSNYLNGCGENSGAHLQDGKLIVKREGYSVKLSDFFERPITSEGLVYNFVIELLPKDTRAVEYHIFSLDNIKKLQIKNLDQLKSYGYEMEEESSIFKEEKILSKQKVILKEKEFLKVTSKKDDKIIFRLMTTYKNSSQIFFIELSMPKDIDEASYKAYSDAAKNVAESLEELN